MRHRVRRVVAPALVLGVACLSVSGCGDSISGTPVAAGASSGAHVSAHLSDLLIDPAKFPAPYQALVLPPHAASQAEKDLTGVAAGAKVKPTGCKPASPKAGPDGTAIVVGTDNDTRATITVELTRVSQSLSVRRDQLQNCGDIAVTANGATAALHSELLPPPPVDADSSLAVTQTVESGSGADALKQSMLTLMAQVGDVRVSATYMSFGDSKPDTATLDSLFTQALTKVAAAR